MDQCTGGALASVRPGDVVDQRFVIERTVRSGGMGVVYRAHDRDSGAPIALKVLRGAPVHEDGLRFEREALVLSAIDHPGIVRYVAHGVMEGGAPYLAMEWIEGEDLAVRLERGPLSPEEALGLGQKLATALGAAHARGVVHRDLKPSNIVLAGGALDRPRIIDFGIAASGAAARVTVGGAIVGTPAYMSPDRARGGPDLDPRDDVFALGCVLHECVTGKRTFEGSHVMAVLAKIVFEPVPRLRDLGFDVPDAFDALIQRMLEKVALARPADGAAAARAIEAIDAASSASSARLRRSERPSLTGAEQRIVCIVLAKEPGDAPRRADQTLPTSGLGAPRAAIAAVEKRGGRSLSLADGTLVVTTKDEGPAVDRAARSAACAIALRAALPGWAVSVATGRAALNAARPMGDAIERAAQRLGARLDRSLPAAIDLDEATAGLLDLRFEVAGGPLGLELSGERDVAEKPRTLLGRPSPFVGRDRDLTVLEALFAECVEEPRSRAVRLTGGAGVGKSRLRHELVERLRASGSAEIWIARGDPMGTGAPFDIIAQLVRRTARLVAGEPVEAQRQKLLARVSRYVLAGQRLNVAEFLGELCGAPFPDEGRVQLRAARKDPRLRGDQMRRAFLELIDAETWAKPLVMVLEDLHWGDVPSAEYIDAALRLFGERPLFILAIGRPELHERLPGLFRDIPSHDIQLGDLSRRAAERLIRGTLGDDIAPEAVARLWKRSSGNAFFLEELLRAAAEGRDEGKLETTLAVVGSRLEMLEPADRRILRAASVFGEVFWRGGIAALLNGDPPRERLALLEEKEWIVRRPSARFHAEEEYAFQHALMREAAYGMLTDEDRALGHRLAGAWLLGAGEPSAGVMAEHFERGGEAESAVHWRGVAAEQDLEGDDLEAVIAQVDRAMALGASGEPLGWLALSRSVAHHWRGEHAEAERWADLARGALPRGGARWCSAMAGLIWAAGERGDGDRTARLSEEILAAITAVEAHVVGAVALTRGVSWLALTGRHQEATAIRRDLDPILARLRSDPTVQAAAALMRVYLVRPEDDPAARRDLLAEAIAHLEEAGDRRQVCLQRTNLAAISNLLGAFAEAEAEARAAEREAERLGLRFAVWAAQSNMGPALSSRGAHAEAVRVLRAAIDGSSAKNDLFITGVTRTYLAAALGRAGEFTAAEIEARRAVTELAAFAPYLCMATAELAHVILAQGRAAEAMDHARAAIEMLGSLGQIDEGEALVRLVHAEALYANGAEDAAVVAILAARDRLLAYAARFRDDRARRRFLEDIPENARTIALAIDWRAIRSA